MPQPQQPHYLIELYTPKPAWLRLPASDRQAFLDAIAQAMAGMAEQGIELLTLAETDAGIDQASPHRYLGIWRFAGRQSRDALLAGIAASGWYAYFDHLNAACGTGDMPQHLRALQAVQGS